MREPRALAKSPGQTKHRRRLTTKETHVAAALTATASAVITYVLLQFSTEVWPDITYGPKAADAYWKLGMATGTATFLLLAITLTITPTRRLRGRRNPIHLPIRRAYGIWTAITAAVHALLGITIHADGWRLHEPFLTAINAQGKGHLLGLALLVGTTTLAILLTLAGISNDRALRQLGRPNWKRLQSLAYIAAAGSLIHVLGIQIWEGRSATHAIILLTIPAITLTLRLLSTTTSTQPKLP